MSQPNEITTCTNNSSAVCTSAHDTSMILYNGESITFERSNGDVMVNATQMAKAFGKRPADFLRLPSTSELIKATVRKYHSDENQLVTTINGGNNPGTWMNRIIALSFAQWLSVDFHLICLEKIEELLTTGVTTVQNDDDYIMARALQIAQITIENHKQRVQILEGENEHLANEVKQLAPKAEYTDKVLQSTSTYTMTQVAKELGMSAVSLEKKLHDKGVIFRQSGEWFPYCKYQDKGYHGFRTHVYPKSDGSEGSKRILVWSEKGRAFIHQIMKGMAL